MTAQFNDIFLYQGERYAVSGISEGELFDPKLLGLNPVAACTACWRGYVAEFSILDARLVLQNLSVNLYNLDDEEAGRQSETGPEINGVLPLHPDGEYELFNNRYENLNYHLEYSGGLLIADGFIQELYVHMGFHPAWKYERVIEFIFDNGSLIDEQDRSYQMSEIRQQYREWREDASTDEDRMPSREEIAEFVNRAFDRRYDL